jgi:Polyketide cyclase / dehydrase and lipid transport
MKRAAVFLLLLMGLFFLLAFGLPRQFTVTKSISIQSRPEIINLYVSDLRKWQLWSVATTDFDENAQFVYAGAEQGVGAAYSWSGTKIGHGQMEIVASSPMDGVKMSEAIESSVVNAFAEIAYAQKGDSTLVTWTDSGTLPAPFGGFFVDSVERKLGQNLQDNLLKLKNIIEHR